MAEIITARRHYVRHDVRWRHRHHGYSCCSCTHVVISISITTVVNDNVSSAGLVISSSTPRVAVCRRLIAQLLTPSVRVADNEAPLCCVLATESQQHGPCWSASSPAPQTSASMKLNELPINRRRPKCDKPRSSSAPQMPLFMPRKQFT